MNVVRWTASGLVFGIGPFIPNLGTDWVVLLGGSLFVLSVMLTLLGRHVRDHAGRSILGHLAMAGDALAGMAAVIVFAPGDGLGVTVAVGVVLIGTGTFRGGVGGSIATLATTVVGYGAREAIGYQAGSALDLTRVGLTLAAYAFAAVVFMGWHAEVRRVLADRARVAARLTLVERITTDLIYEWDIASGSLSLSDAASTQLGYAIGHQRLDRGWWEERLHPEDAGPVRDALASLLRGTERGWEMDYRFRKADGTYTTVHDRGYVVHGGGRRRRPLRMVGSLVNVDSVSLYDPVTRLAGRALFADRVERRVARARGERSAVLIADVQHWRERSASIGAERAEAILAELAQRLEKHVREGETVARIGHDQMAFLVSAPSGEEAVARAAQIRDAARVPFGGEVRLEVVVGAAVLADGQASELLSEATAALADAKRTRRHVALYEPGAEQRWDRRIELRDDLRGALERRELRVRFQPVADAKSRRCVALEALVRWRHGELGEIDATDLLPVASDLELRAAIDRWVIQEAVRAIAQVRRTVPHVRMYVNVSPVSLNDGIATMVRAALASALLPSDALTFDVPEDPALEHGPAAKALRDLREVGVGIAIDDFGTGYASALRTTIPASEVKIDRVFASRVATDEHALAIVRSTVARAHERAMRVVAEGVEDPATAARLRDLGVDLIQGRVFAQPMPLETVIRWLAPAVPAPPLPSRGESEAADRLDERLVLLGEHARREPLGTVPG